MVEQYHYSLIHLSKLGIEIRYADPSDPSNFEKLIDDKTRAFYGETLPNPYLRVFQSKKFLILEENIIYH